LIYKPHWAIAYPKLRFKGIIILLAASGGELNPKRLKKPAPFTEPVFTYSNLN
jgi:hypothetical protein